MDEIWKPIKGFEGYYKVSNLGNVMGVRGGKNKTKRVSNMGYFYAELWKENKGRKILIHRLVATAFISNPNNYPCVLHRDDNPKNNELDNLFWGSQKDNMQDCLRKGRNKNKVFNGEKNGFSKLNDSQVKIIKENLLKGINCVQIARTFNVDRTTISQIKRGLAWKHIII